MEDAYIDYRSCVCVLEENERGKALGFPNRGLIYRYIVFIFSLKAITLHINLCFY